MSTKCVWTDNSQILANSFPFQIKIVFVYARGILYWMYSTSCRRTLNIMGVGHVSHPCCTSLTHTHIQITLYNKQTHLYARRNDISGNVNFRFANAENPSLQALLAPSSPITAHHASTHQSHTQIIHYNNPKNSRILCGVLRSWCDDGGGIICAHSAIYFIGWCSGFVMVNVFWHGFLWAQHIGSYHRGGGVIRCRANASHLNVRQWTIHTNTWRGCLPSYHSYSGECIQCVTWHTQADTVPQNTYTLKLCIQTQVKYMH